MNNNLALFEEKQIRKTWNDSNGIKELKSDMNTAGKVINTAKERIETELGQSLVTSDNYKDLTKI